MHTEREGVTMAVQKHTTPIIPCNRALYEELLSRALPECHNESLLLTNVCTDTAWFVEMWEMPLCFIRGRLSFTRDGHNGESPRYANVIAYLGHQTAGFAKVFDSLGHIVTPRRPAGTKWPELGGLVSRDIDVLDEEEYS